MNAAFRPTASGPRRTSAALICPSSPAGTAVKFATRTATSDASKRQSTSCCSLRSRRLPVARKWAPSTAPVVLNAQHDPHAPCVLTPVTAPRSRQSKVSGSRVTSSSVAGAAAAMLRRARRWKTRPGHDRERPPPSVT
nr:unnamed protein product [Digitaria exilis]